MYNPFFLTFRSAYRSKHSIETALLYVLSDIVDAIDNGHVAILVLLDLTAAFDTIDHPIVLQHLERSVVVSLKFIDLTASYLTERIQSVVIDDDTAHKKLSIWHLTRICTGSSSIYFIHY